MQLREIMTRNVETVGPEATVREAAHRMAEVNIGFLVVAGGDGPAGVVTDRDLVVRGLAVGHGPETPIGELMTPSCEALDESADVEEAAAVMKDKQIRRVLVRGEGGAIVGVVSLGDLACDTGDDELSGATLEAVSEPASPVRMKG